MCALVVASALPVVSLAAQGRDPRDIGMWMARVGERVEAYFARAQSIICEETVRLEPLGADLLSNGEHIRTLVYELRVEWNPAAAGALPDATVVRQLLTVDGRPPRAEDKPGCFDREPVSSEPLEMLLPNHQGDYVFAWKGEGRESGRPSVTIEYRPVRAQAAHVVWKGDCLKVELPGRTRGRVWLDPATADVLKLEEQLTGQYDIPVSRARSRTASSSPTFTIERADSSISYRPVTFHDPEETAMLPASIISLQVIRNSGTPRLRTYQTFSKYRRFLTGARVVQ